MAAKTFYIELPPDASPTLELAGRELGHYVRAVLAWEPLSAKGPEAYRFRLGTRRTSFAFRTFLNQVMKPLGDDGFRAVADATTTTFCAETDKGVLNAVYSFLAGLLRVRWAEPGPLGEILPRRLVRPWWPMDVVETPAFSVRGMHLGEGVRWCREEELRCHLEWMARNRLNHIVVRSDSYERLRDVFVEECRRRALTLEVEVSSLERGCASSREDVARYARSCASWVRDHPEAEIVNLAPADARPCECESCRPLSAGAQWSRFLCPALAALRGEFPERQFASRVGAGLYEPQEGDPECRLGVGLLFDTSVRSPWHELGNESSDANVFLLNVLKEWKSIATASVCVLENVAAPARLSQGVVNPETLSRDMTTYRSLGLAGVVVLADVHSFGSCLLDFNLFARLAWDLEANYRGLWPDLCVMYFGGYSFRVLDVVERLRAAEGRRLSDGEWQGLEALLGPVFEGESDLFTRRYRRLREGVLYMRELARLETFGERLRRARAAGDRPGAIEAARAAHKSFLDAWAIVERSRLSGMFDALDALANFIARGLNSQALAEKYDFFPRPFRTAGGAGAEVSLRRFLAALEAEGLSVDAMVERAEKEFADWRDRFIAIAPRLPELVDDIDFGFDRPGAPAETA